MERKIGLWCAIMFPLIGITYFFISERKERNSYDLELVVKEEGVTDSAGRQGEWKGYNKIGKQLYEGTYLNGSKHGEWTYFNDDNRIIKTEVYKEGFLNGKQIIYNNGVVYDEISYESGKRNGTHMHYFKSGRINYLQDYKNDSMTGKFEVYSSAGRMTQQGRLFRNKNAGMWKMYNEDGQLKEINIFDSLTDACRIITIGVNNDTISDRVQKNTQ